MSAKLAAAIDAISEAVYAENERGGQARRLILDIGIALGVNIAQQPVGGDTWSYENMARVRTAAEALASRVEGAR